MSRNIRPEDLGTAIANELTVYHKNVIERVNESGRAAIKKLVKITKTTAPVGERGSFKKNINSREDDTGRGMKSFTWYVKAPDHRLTHLLVHGHATKDGGQELIVIFGHGWYQEEGQPARELFPGDIVNIPPNVKHWHGAAKDSWFQHLALEIEGEDAWNEWLEPVSDEEYDKLG